jgi:hypothetical protein
VHWVDDSVIVYPAKTTSLDRERGMSQLSRHLLSLRHHRAAVSGTNYLAIAERAGVNATISIVDLRGTLPSLWCHIPKQRRCSCNLIEAGTRYQTLKRRKVLTSADTDGNTYVSMCFSPDSRLLLAQGGRARMEPRMLWLWEEAPGQQPDEDGLNNATIYQCLLLLTESRPAVQNGERGVVHAALA